MVNSARAFLAGLAVGFQFGQRLGRVLRQVVPPGGQGGTGSFFQIRDPRAQRGAPAPLLRILCQSHRERPLRAGERRLGVAHLLVQQKEGVAVGKSLGRGGLGAAEQRSDDLEHDTIL